MYRFFRITSGIEAKQLPPWERILADAGLCEMVRKKFYGGMISASLQRNTDSGISPSL
jgi:hypothetical protein